MYKKLIKQKKRRAAEDLHLQLSTLKTSHPREFWNIVSKLTGVNQKRIPISITDMASHFQELNTNTTVHLFPHNSASRLTITYVEELDEDIFEEEVQCAIQRLKTNKSPGLDGLYPELFKLFNNNMVQTITRIFNSVYNSGIFPTPWSIGCIKPIYKKGDESLPSNYRGITLLPIMAKLFTSILNKRLWEWTESNKKINDSQFGFRMNRRTTDALFIIHTISLFAVRQKKPMFLAFIDLSKAFDSLNHDLLWAKLSTFGVSVKLLSILKHMYSYDGYTSSEFRCAKGVRQGCPLSPLLFCLFISDLDYTLKSSSTGKIVIEQEEITVIMFADDLVLLADSSEGLQQSLAVFQDYCNSWKLKINAEKSKVMIYARVPQPLQYRFFYQ